MGCLIRAQRGLRRATNNEDRLRFLGSDTPVGFFKVTWVACGGQKQVPSVGERQVFHVSEWITANTSKFGRYTPLAAGILSRLEVWPDTPSTSRTRPPHHAREREFTVCFVFVFCVSAVTTWRRGVLVGDGSVGAACPLTTFFALPELLQYPVP